MDNNHVGSRPPNGRFVAVLAAAILTGPWYVQADEASSAEPTHRVLEEVFVTAQKQVQSLRDVPLSVSALSGADLREAGIEDLHSVSRITPNVQINQEQNRAYIRGFGAAANQTVEQPVAIVIDGVYYGRAGYLRDGFLDLERLEVLRGPQSTLFGKNAVAGVLNFVTVRPSEDFELHAKAQGGSSDQERYELVLNGPVIPDILSARFSAAKSTLGDWVDNTFTGDAMGAVNTENNRLKLAFPVGSNIDAILSVEKTSQEQFTPIAQVHVATENLRSTYSSFDPNIDFVLNRKTSLNTPMSAERDGVNSYLTFESEVWSHSISSLTSYSDTDDANSFDADIGPAPLLVLQAGEKYRQASQEFRIASDPLNNLSYIAGLYYFRAHLVGFNRLKIVESNNNGQEFTDVVTPEQVEAMFSPVAGSADLGTLAPEQTEGHFNQITESRAIFGQLNWRFRDDFLLSAGGRYNREDKSIVAVRRQSENAVVLRALGGEGFNVKDKIEERDFSPRISGTYELNDEINVYATWAKGFKAGGYSSSTLQEDNLKFKKEKVRTIELGIKGRFLAGAGRFNLGLFRTNFKDLQVTASNGQTFEISNAASALSQGLEFDTTVAATESLTISGSIGYLHARYDEYTNAPCKAGASEEEQNGSEDGTCDLSGESLAQAPRWNATIQAEYSYDFGKIWSVAQIQGFIGYSANYQSEMFNDLDLDPLDIRKAVTIHDARFGVRSNSRSWQLTFAVRNMFDEIYKVQSTDVALFAGSHWGMTNAERRYTANLSFDI